MQSPPARTSSVRPASHYKCAIFYLGREDLGFKLIAEQVSSKRKVMSVLPFDWFFPGSRAHPSIRRRERLNRAMNLDLFSLLQINQIPVIIRCFCITFDQMTIDTTLLSLLFQRSVH